MICFPNLQTERLWLRQAIEEDAKAVFAIFCDPKMTQFHDKDTFTHLNQAIRVIEVRANRFRNERGISWAITHKLDNCLIGSCGFTWDREANTAEVGYELASQFWRQGIMSEALRAILNYGFEIEGVKLVSAEVMIGNVASKRLLEKLGFQSQGVMKERGFWKGKYHDLEQFVLMKS